MNSAEDHISIPESLLTATAVEDVIEIMVSAGLKTILTQAPTADGGCSCGKKNCGRSAGKHPIARNWQNHEFTLDELRDQMSRLKFTPNVSLVLGKQASGEYLIAVDVDDMDRIAVLEEELGPLTETPRCDSGRGYRLFYRAPPEVDVLMMSNVTGLGGEPGVDVKVERGQVVVAPSLHQNGKRYVWTVAGPVSPLPVQWAMAMLKKPEPPKWIDKYTPSSLKASGHARGRAEKYLEAAVQGEARALSACGEGMRNSTLFRSGCRMFRLCGGLYLGMRWQWVHDELLSAARSAGLPESESRKTLGSAERTVRESGEVTVPVWLADPGSPPPSGSPAEASHDGGDAPSATSGGTGGSGKDKKGRPIIRITTELHETVEEATRALRNDPEIYQRDRRLVTITEVTQAQVEQSPHVEMDDGALHRQLVAGSPQIHLVTRAVIKARLSKVAVFQKWIESSQQYKPQKPPDDVVSHIHDQGQWDGLRLLVGVTETPTFGPNGKIHQTPGYDPETCYEYKPSGTFPEIRDEAATQENARYYYNLLSDVFVDFPYVNEYHRSVPIAAILTLLARPAIVGSIPAVVFDASTRGSGKTLQTDAVAIIATGRGAPRMNYTSDEVELEKILGGYAIKGSPFICLDNVPPNKPFGGGPLDRCITARDKVDLRVLGRSEVPTLLWRSLIMATGNNMIINSDTSRRILMARLEPTEERPEARSDFRHEEILTYVRNQRNRLVSGALLILRAYHRAGRPNMGCARWGSFEEWSALIPNAIVFAGGADPMKSRPESDEEVDPETQAISGLLMHLPKLHQKLREIAPEAIGDDGIAARTIIAALYEQDPEWPEFEPLKDAIETLCRGRKSGHPDAGMLSYKLRAMRSRVIGGRKLVGTRNPENITMWRVVTL